MTEQHQATPITRTRSARRLIPGCRTIAAVKPSTGREKGHVMRRAPWILGTLTLGLLGGMLAGGFAYAGRNSSGTYSNVTGPFVPGTTIQSSAFNTQWSDWATALSDSLSRSGQGGMLAPLRGTDGSVTAPSISFTNETGTGLYRIGSGSVGLSVAGTRRLAVDGTHLSVTGDVNASGLFGTDKAGTAVYLTSGSVQSIAKVNNLLSIGTGDANNIELFTNSVTRWAIDSTKGSLNSNGTATVTGIPSPTGPSDAATKGYVDSNFVTSSTAAATYAPLASPTFTGTVTVPALSGGSASTSAANKGYIDGLTEFATRAAVTGVGSGCTTQTIFTVPYVANTKAHFAGMLYVGGSASVSCTPSVSVGGLYYVTVSGAGNLGGAVSPTTATATGTTTLTSTSIGTGTSTALRFEGALYQTSGGGSGTLTCKCAGGGGTILAGSVYQLNIDN